MIETKQMDIRANIKKYFDIAFEGEPVIVCRKENRNVVIISETEYKYGKSESFILTGPEAF